MGAHNLGEAHFGNSGFSGTWVSNEQVWQGLIKHQHECYTVNMLQFYFNNQYYTNLVNTSLDWQLEQSSCGTSVNNSVTNRDNVDNKSGNVDTSSGNVDTNSGSVDNSSGNVDTSSANVDTSSGNVDTISINVDTNSGNVDNEAAENRGCTPGQQADWHWTAASGGFSLNTDMALLKVTHPQYTQSVY